MRAGELSEETLRADLTRHVEAVDQHLAEEFEKTSGGDKARERVDFFLALPRLPAGASKPTVLHSTTCVIELW